MGNVNRIWLKHHNPPLPHHYHHRFTKHEEVQVRTRANLIILLNYYYALNSLAPLSLSPNPVIVIRNTNDMMSPRGQMTGGGKATA